MANKTLMGAKRAKNDEFYTQYSDIDKEVHSYLDYNPDVFRGKTVLCNCDDPYTGNFFKFFALNFNAYGLKRLISASYDPSPIAGTQLPFSQIAGMQNSDKKAYVFDSSTMPKNLDDTEKMMKTVKDVVEYGKQFLIIGNMNAHLHDDNIKELKTYFETVIKWIDSVFTTDEKEMCGLEWGRLYKTYHSQRYDPAKVNEQVQKLYADPYVKNRRGIFEYILGGCTDKKLLDVRVFDEATKRSVYAKQTEAAKAEGKSNCPLCAIGTDANKARIWELREMDAVFTKNVLFLVKIAERKRSARLNNRRRPAGAWSKGGATDAANCQMLCVTHNRAKGNR